MKHTKGEWNYIETVNHPDNENEVVSFIQTGGGFAFDLCNVDVIPRQEVRANAKLIAAAPDLLEALKLIECQLFNKDGSAKQPDSVSWHAECFYKMKKAIEKATK